MAATMLNVLRTAIVCGILFVLLLWAYAHGQARCQASQQAHPAATDTHVNGGC